MPHYCLHRLADMLPKSLARSKILVVGVTYKKDVTDLRKSPSLRLIELLKAQARVDYFDPMVPYLKLGGIDLMPVALTPQTLKKYDAVVIAVDHTKVDYALILKHAKLIFDIKNIYKDARSKKIVKL
jgi:UDP-N-acetyl-D-glucosamine dehydrogenase